MCFLAPAQINVAVILVETEDSINVGSVARAMSNLGFADLRLVAPKNYVPERAKISACWASELINSAAVYDSLSKAVADCEQLFGFSSQPGKHRIAHQSLLNWAPTIALESRIGLLFGPESTGLRSHHWEECTSLIAIPSSQENPSYNLAQAVLIALFELRRSHVAPQESPSENQQITRRSLKPAEIGALRQLEPVIEELGVRGGFLNENSSPDIRNVLNHMFRRIQPSNRELSVLMGFLCGVLRKLKSK